jgi:hypothetical protein
LPKCKPAILICRATRIWFGHYRKCVIGRPNICRGNCGNVLSATRISLQPNGLSTYWTIAFATYGPAKRADISLRIPSTSPRAKEPRPISAMTATIVDYMFTGFLIACMLRRER